MFRLAALKLRRSLTAVEGMKELVLFYLNICLRKCTISSSIQCESRVKRGTRPSRAAWRDSKNSRHDCAGEGYNNRFQDGTPPTSKRRITHRQLVTCGAQN